jgi:hydroxymethylglutaryl-CoA synthase
MTKVGIAALDITTTARALELDTLAELRGVDPAKYARGLECEQMSVCGEGEDVRTLAVSAARGALESWGGDPGELGALIVGTETAVDMSRPLSAWVADALGLKGRLRSYEVKHACYGGTAAIRQATEWVASGAARGKAALVVAADVALYAPEDPGEPTQGAGAAAMIVSEDARVAELEIASYPYTYPAFDFWRPVGEAFPRVDGKFSLECYKECARECFAAWLEQEGEGALDTLGAICFHVPFPKMVKKAFFHVADELGWANAQELYDARVAPHMRWNRRTGNSYTAASWFAFAHAAAAGAPGQRVGVFSYGSGAGAELLFARIKEPLGQVWIDRVDASLSARAPMSAQEYLDYRS